MYFLYSGCYTDEYTISYQKFVIQFRPKVICMGKEETYLQSQPNLCTYCLYIDMYVQLGWLCEYVASSPMQITLGQNHMTINYNFVYSSI